MLMISLQELDKKELHSHAHRLLRECLRPFGVRYDENTPVIRGKLGKPCLAERPDIHYNLSHAAGIAACIVSDRRCGIDCEAVREYRPNVMRRAFSDAERRSMEEAPENMRDELFFRLWTLKEAYVKALGIGISYPLDTVEFSFEGDRIITNVKDCRFRQYLVGGGRYAVSVCELSDASESRGSRQQ